MPTYGLTATGFVIRSLENINALVISAIQSAIGVAPVDALLTVLQIYNERLAEIWQLAQAIYDSGNVDAAVDAAQDNLNAITSTKRKGARTSTTVLTWTGNPGVPVTANTQAKTSVSLQLFTTDTSTGLIVALPAYAINTVYGEEARVTANSRCYVCRQGGTSAAAGTGPSSTGIAIAEGPDDLQWDYLGDGTGAVDIAAHALITGPITAAARSITVIDTHLSGVLGVINVLDAAIGADKETNADYRVRRVVELAQPGSGTSSAIKAALAEVTGATNITVFQNTTDAINVDGMLPHSVEVLVRGGDSMVIAQLILANVDGGIQTVGNTSQFVTNPSGFIVQVFFSRPIERNVYNTLSITYDPLTFPLNGVAQIQTAISVYGQTSSTGVDARPYQVGRIAGAIAGVLDITGNLISVYPVTVPVASVNIPFALRELAIYDTSRIIVNITPGTP